MKLFPLFLSLLAVYSCNQKEELTFYVSNNSSITKENSINVYLDDSLIIKKTFTYSDIVPHDEIFIIKTDKNVQELKIIEDAYGNEEIDTIRTKNDRYIFIGFNEFKRKGISSDSVKRVINILKRKEFTKQY